MDKELQNKLNNGFKRMSIVVVLWALIGILPILFINSKYYPYYLIGWDFYFFIGILVSGKIVNKIWK